MGKWRCGPRFTCPGLALQLVLLAAGLLPVGSVRAAAPGAAISVGGRLADGAMWKASVPARWKFWISADAPDVNVYAVLEDVSADGHSTYITDGRLRASWRRLARPPWGDSSEHWHRGYTKDIVPLTTGEPTEVVFDFYAASYVVRAGHRLRVSLATALGEPWQAPPLAGAKRVTLTVYRDASHASEILIPVVSGRSTLSKTAERRPAAARALRGRPAV